MSPVEEPLRFGTAGLRGPLGDGPGHMNVDTVAHATAGVARWLRADDRPGSVVVGRDARHGSAEFAATTAGVFAAAGFEVHWFDEPLPTPVVAFAVRHLGAVAGVVITASHNPAGDNGYKLYLGDGAQIIPPVDGEIEDLIDEVRAAEAPPERAAVEPSPGAPIVAAYLAGAMEVVDPATPRELRVVATAMHGVGAPVLRAAFAEAGFDPPIEVAAQGDPDPDFPTVAFPNPEEPGALDLALALGTAERADLVVANDPDADRLAAAVPTDPDRTAWRPLTGDELGALLADHLLRRRSPGPDAVVATTVVSGRLLQAMAAEAGVPYVETLTGFKWVTRAPGPGRRLLFGYEEALGYSVTDLVRDKDGITAALVLAELAAIERDAGRTLLDRLDDLHRRFGAHHTAQRSLRVPGADWLVRVTATMASLRATPPSEIAGRVVQSVEDLLTGERLPASDVLIWQLDGVRLVVRPSGTEPKLKCYAEAVVPEAGDLESARAQAAAAVEDALTATFALLGERGLGG
ncbi:MAG: phospho-sugar mutase [Actinomycetota bacterium]|nr:phospho-sugar mutase [Actinomycetota bacterium]